MSEFIMMVGIPGCGKSTLADKISKEKDYPVIGSDRVRGELYGDEAIQGDPIEVFSKIVDNIMVHAKVGQSVIYDATSIKKKYRIQMIQRFRKYYDIMKAIVVAEPYEVCVARNASRARVAPEYVLKRMYEQFEMPGYWEGFDEIEIYSSTGSNILQGELLQSMMDFNQENIHHTLSLGEHQLAAVVYLYDQGIRDKVLLNSTLFHDIGKLTTKVYTDYSGKVTEDAHYYGHMNTGAYDSLFLNRGNFTEEEVIERAQLIQYHMQPYFNRTESDNLKWEKKLGKELWDKVLKLHEADEQAH